MEMDAVHAGNAVEPQAYSLLLPWGDAESLRILEKANWIGQGFVFARAILPKVRARYGTEFARSGVYVLSGSDDETQAPRIYVGQGVIKERLAIHAAEKDFWTRVTLFTSKDDSLNTAHREFIEARLIVMAKESRRVECENDVIPRPKQPGGHDTAMAEGFLRELLAAFPILGLDAFRLPPLPSDLPYLQLRGKGAMASGTDGPEGFEVFAGSTASLDEAASCPAAARGLRETLLALGVLHREATQLRFARGYTFTSSSLAAAVVLGNSVNGREAWRDKQGKSLKELQMAGATLGGSPDGSAY